jgi:predicted amidohydrolase
MRDIRVAAAQFEHRNNDKAYNLSRVRALTRRAVEQGAEIVSFHECSVTGYTFLRRLDRAGLVRLAEPVPEGPSPAALIEIARRHGVVIMAGLIEAERDRFYKTYVTVGPEGFITRFRKLHPFINRHIVPGEAYHVTELRGVRAVFSNAVGRDDDTIKPGLAMVLDPFGEVQAQSRSLEDDVVVTELKADKLERAPGRRYLRARRPELYAKLVEPHPAGQAAVTEPGWKV